MRVAGKGIAVDSREGRGRPELARFAAEWTRGTVPHGSSLRGASGLVKRYGEREALRGVTFAAGPGSWWR